MNTCQTWFSKLKIQSGNGLSGPSMGNMRKSFIAIQLLRPTTMPLKQALLIIRQPWSAWQIVSAISILSWIKVCSLQGLCYTIWPKWSSWRDLKIQNTLFEATSSATLHWSMKKSPRSCKSWRLMTKKKKSSSFAMWSWVTMACWNTVVLFVQKSWKQRLFIWSTIWMRKWWWWQQHLA